MADIDVVPKQGSKTWLWIVIAAVIVIAILWIAFGSSGTPARQGHKLGAAPSRVAISSSLPGARAA
jgi:hypothetical protein